MTIAEPLATLFERDLKRLEQQLRAFSEEEMLWRPTPGMSNSPGNLMLHLEGNLREFVCRLMGGIPYQRVRPLEFSTKGVATAEMAARIEKLIEDVPAVIRGLSAEQLATPVEDQSMSTQQFLMHLYGHFSYHLGQIDAQRRMLTEGSAVDYVR